MIISATLGKYAMHTTFSMKSAAWSGPFKVPFLVLSLKNNRKLFNVQIQISFNHLVYFFKVMVYDIMRNSYNFFSMFHDSSNYHKFFAKFDLCIPFVKIIFKFRRNYSYLTYALFLNRTPDYGLITVSNLDECQRNAILMFRQLVKHRLLIHCHYSKNI